MSVAVQPKADIQCLIHPALILRRDLPGPLAQAVLIVQNEIGNRHSPTVIAAAITSRLDKARLPTHINIRAEDTGLAKDSVVLLEQIRTLDKHRLRERAGQITAEDQRRVDQALDVSLGLSSY